MNKRYVEEDLTQRAQRLEDHKGGRGDLCLFFEENGLNLGHFM